ncbi:MAG: hypothetical protein C0606_03385 [Hyphomicrobiales bacterium]|nr:MAG: hypothetical protein C0606_03385 [Hyphomicrobiales bacterium]
MAFTRVRFLALAAFAGTLSLQLAPSHAATENANDALRFAGGWVMADELSGRGCALMLDPAPTGRGHRIDGLSGCAKAFPILSRVAAWMPGTGGGIAFVDGKGTVVVDYGIGETDGLQSVAPQHVFYSLTAAAPYADPTPVGSIGKTRRD